LSTNTTDGDAGDSSQPIDEEEELPFRNDDDDMTKDDARSKSIFTITYEGYYRNDDERLRQ